MPEGHCANLTCDGKRWMVEDRGMSLDCLSNVRFVQNHQGEDRRTSSQPTDNTPQSQPDGPVAKASSPNGQYRLWAE